MFNVTRVGVAGFAILTALLPGAVTAQTLTEALSSAYSTNPTLNIERAQLRGVDEGIAIARSGNRPVVQGTFNYLDQTTRTDGTNGRVISTLDQETQQQNTVRVGNVNATNGVRSYAFNIRLDQPIFNGFQTRNSIRQSESAVQAGRADLQNTEQDVLFATAVAFLDVVQNRQIVQLRENDVQFLGEQVRAAQDRFDVGEGTRTDVSQSEAQRAQSLTALNFAQANLANAEAAFRRQSGLVAQNLRDNYNVERLLPTTLAVALEIGQRAHPAIIASLHNVDVNIFNVATLEGQALPTVSAFAQASSTFEPSTSVDRSDQASFGINVTVPFYQGGLVSAQVRQAKENLGAARIQVDLNRDIIRQSIATAWAAYQSSVRSIFNAQTGVFSGQLALQGVLEEQRVGQRTTLDVLDQQSDLIVAQVTLVQALRDRDANAFQLLSATGRLTASQLGLSVAVYQPAGHTDAVRGKWSGFRTPDGR